MLRSHHDGLDIDQLFPNWSPLDQRLAESLDLIEDFDGAALDAAVWESTGGKTVTVADSKITLNWIVNPDVTSVSIDNGIGDVTDFTVGGAGQIEFVAPDVNESTPIEYVMTVAKGADKQFSSNLKRGMKSKPIRLVDGDHEIDCKMDGMSIGLKAQFVKKVTG